VSDVVVKCVGLSESVVILLLYQSLPSSLTFMRHFIHFTLVSSLTDDTLPGSVG